MGELKLSIIKKINSDPIISVELRNLKLCRHTINPNEILINGADILFFDKIDKNCVIVNSKSDIYIRADGSIMVYNY